MKWFIVCVMETQNQQNTRPGCGCPLKGCAITTGILFIGLIVLLTYFAKKPSVRNMIECRSNMMEIGAALERYQEVNDSYPAQLDDLKKDYLKDPSTLRCPLDKSSDACSYVYHRPQSESPDDFVVLECDRHKLTKDVPVTKLILHKSGEISVEAPERSKRNNK